MRQYPPGDVPAERLAIDGRGPEVPALRSTADAVADRIAAAFTTRIGMRGIRRAATSIFDAAAPPLAKIASKLKMRLPS